MGVAVLLLTRTTTRITPRRGEEGEEGGGDLR